MAMLKGWKDINLQTKLAAKVCGAVPWGTQGVKRMYWFGFESQSKIVSRKPPFGCGGR
jgi:hypothetical protein